MKGVLAAPAVRSEVRAPQGVRPHVPVQVVREYTYVYTAVAPALGQMVSLILPVASTEMMNLAPSADQSDFLQALHCDASRWSRLASRERVGHRRRIFA